MPLLIVADRVPETRYRGEMGLKQVGQGFFPFVAIFDDFFQGGAHQRCCGILKNH